MNLTKELSKNLDPQVTQEELDFAITQFENNQHLESATKVYDDTALDILHTNIEFYRKHNLGGKL